MKDTIRSILDSQRFAVLATEDKGVPCTGLVAFSFTEDLKYLLIITPRDTVEYGNIKANPYVSLFIDNRANRGPDIAAAAGLSVTGAAGELDESAKEDLLGPFLVRHPELAEFAWSPENALVSVEVTAYTVVRGGDRADVVDPHSFAL